MPDAPASAQIVPILISLAIIVPVLIWRRSRARKLRVELLWIRPVLFGLVAVLVVINAPPVISPLSIALMVMAIALGAAAGWQRGKMMRIEVDPATHAVSVRASPAALVFIVGLIVLRYAVRDMAFGNVSALGLPLGTLIDILALFSAAMMVTQAVEMSIRARRLLAQARAIPITS